MRLLKITKITKDYQGLPRITRDYYGITMGLPRDYPEFTMKLPEITRDYHEINDNVVRDYLQFLAPRTWLGNAKGTMIHQQMKTYP